LLVVLLIGWAVLALAFAITSWLLPGMEISGGFWSYLWVSALFGIVNAIAGAILIRIGRAPQSALLTGLLALLLSAVLLEITASLTDSLTIDDFWWTAIWAALILAVVTVFIEVVLFSLLLRRAPRTT
jgi:putative membrane protein